MSTVQHSTKHNAAGRRAGLIREACVGTVAGMPPGKTAAMDLRCSCISLL